MCEKGVGIHAPTNETATPRVPELPEPVTASHRVQTWAIAVSDMLQGDTRPRSGQSARPGLSACPCGRGLHYTNPAQQHAVEKLVDMYGTTVKVRTPDGAWHVPRHYIALHGLTATELPSLADRYGWSRA